MGSVRALVVVEGDPTSDADPSLRPGFPGVQIDAFILQGPPETLDEDVVDTAPFAVHRDPAADENGGGKVYHGSGGIVLLRAA